MDCFIIFTIAYLISQLISCIIPIIYIRFRSDAFNRINPELPDFKLDPKHSINNHKLPNFDDGEEIVENQNVDDLDDFDDDDNDDENHAIKCFVCHFSWLYVLYFFFPYCMIFVAYLEKWEIYGKKTMHVLSINICELAFPLILSIIGAITSDDFNNFSKKWNGFISGSVVAVFISLKVYKWVNNAFVRSNSLISRYLYTMDAEEFLSYSSHAINYITLISCIITNFLSLSFEPITKIDIVIVNTINNLNLFTVFIMLTEYIFHPIVCIYYANQLPKTVHAYNKKVFKIMENGKTVSEIIGSQLPRSMCLPRKDVEYPIYRFFPVIEKSVVINKNKKKSNYYYIGKILFVQSGMISNNPEIIKEDSTSNEIDNYGESVAYNKMFDKIDKFYHDFDKRKGKEFDHPEKEI